MFYFNQDGSLVLPVEQILDSSGDFPDAVIDEARILQALYPMSDAGMIYSAHQIGRSVRNYLASVARKRFSVVLN